MLSRKRTRTDECLAMSLVVGRAKRSETMSAKLRVPLFVRLGNAITTLLLRRGVRMGTNTLLTVPGRKSGMPRTTPVTVIELDGRRYLSSPFGEVDWVRNLRAAGAATLTRGRHSEAISAIELTAEEAAPVLRQALTIAPGVIRSYFDVTSDSPLEEIVREASRHPTFELLQATAEETAA
jgi:deazaflavin-dependent oxidoreductase (nitroreductase family)